MGFGSYWIRLVPRAIGSRFFLEGGIEAVRSHRCTGEVEINTFVIRSHNGAIMCLFDRTKDRINI